MGSELIPNKRGIAWKEERIKPCFPPGSTYAHGVFSAFKSEFIHQRLFVVNDVVRIQVGVYASETLRGQWCFRFQGGVYLVRHWRLWNETP
jgi:hypothetical protein